MHAASDPIAALEQLEVVRLWLDCIAVGFPCPSCFISLPLESAAAAWLGWFLLCLGPMLFM